MSSAQSVIEGWPGLMVHVGLGSPVARAFTAATVVGIGSYMLKVPRESFRRDGSMRPYASLSPSADATHSHFLLMPLTVGAFVFLCT